MIRPASLPEQVTQLLGEWRDGDASALDRLFPLVQPELQRLARHYMSRERPDHTLQATALLDDAYLQLAEKSNPQWQDRAHFFVVAAQLMRRIMLDPMRARNAAKRGGGTIGSPSTNTRRRLGSFENGGAISSQVAMRTKPFTCAIPATSNARHLEDN